jgi:hypothetical protein
MQELLEKRHKRHVFVFCAVLVLLILLLLRYFVVVPHYCVQETSPCRISNDLLDNLFSSSLAAVSITVLLFVLTPPVVRRATLTVIEPREIRFLLDHIRAGTNRYWFVGNSGRYTRGVTMPYLAETARAENRGREPRRPS